ARRHAISRSATDRFDGPRRAHSSPPVDVRPVGDRLDHHGGTLIVNGVDDAVVAPPGAVEAFELEAEWAADAAPVHTEPAVYEFDDRGRDLLGDAIQGSKRRARPL